MARIDEQRCSFCGKRTCDEPKKCLAAANYEARLIKRQQAEPREVAVGDLPYHAKIAWLMNQVEQLTARVEALERQGRRHEQDLIPTRIIGGPLR